MADISLSLNKREGLGKNKVDKIRKDGQIPGILYMHGQDPIPVVGEKNKVIKVTEEAGTATIVNVDIDGEKQLALFKDIQMHPFKNEILHFDLMGINLKEKIRLMIPVVLEGRDEIRVEPSVLFQLLDEVEIEVLPTHLPSEAVANVADMQIGDVLTVADTDVAEIEEITILTELDEPIASLNEPREEEIDEDEDLEEVSAADVPTVDETEADDEEVADEEE